MTNASVCQERVPGIFHFAELSEYGCIHGITGKRFTLNERTSPVSYSSGIPELGTCERAIYFPRQIHSAQCVIITRALTIPEEADAVITNEAMVPLGIITADCVPIFLYDENHHAVGLIHGGWRGLQQGIIENTIRAMKQAFGTKPADLRAAIGPCIHACCYEVQRDVAQHFEGCYHERRGSLFLDLPEKTRRDLISKGIKEERILTASECTRCLHDTFYSYRKEGKGVGKNISLIMIKGD